LVFHFGGEKSSADNLDWSISPILTVLILGEKTNRLADNLSGLDTFVFHFGGEFYSTDNFDDDVCI
jgi:hypothetical protein